MLASEPFQVVAVVDNNMLTENWTCGNIQLAWDLTRDWTKKKPTLKSSCLVNSHVHPVGKTSKKVDASSPSAPNDNVVGEGVKLDSLCCVETLALSNLLCFLYFVCFFSFSFILYWAATSVVVLQPNIPRVDFQKLSLDNSQSFSSLSLSLSLLLLI